jgi:hypothetical protein
VATFFPFSFEAGGTGRTTCFSLVSFFLAIHVHSFVGEVDSGVFWVSEPSASDFPETIFSEEPEVEILRHFRSSLEETSFLADPRYGVEFPLHPLQMRLFRRRIRIRGAG